MSPKRSAAGKKGPAAGSPSAQRPSKQPRGEQTPQRKSQTAAPHGVEPAWQMEAREGRAIVRMTDGEKFCVEGFASIKMVVGSCWICGRLINAGDPPMELRPGPSPGCILEAQGPPPKVAASAHHPKSRSREAHPSALSSHHRVPQSRSHGGFSVELELTSPARLADDANPSFTVSHAETDGILSSTLLPPEWRQAAEKAARGCCGPPVVAVTGSKGAGKSTFGRLLVNTMLNHWPSVVYVDTDVGQPEFTPPGAVSVHVITELLVGPPHVNQRRRWARGTFLGDISPASDPDAYMAAVGKLMAWARGASGFSNSAPVVINTHGWVKGLGLDLLAMVLSSTHPSHVVQLDAGNINRDLPPGRWWVTSEDDGTCEHICLPSARTLMQTLLPEVATPQLSIAESRSQRWVSWVYLCAGVDLPESVPGLSDGKAHVAAANTLAELTPLTVPLDMLALKFLHSTVPSGLEYFVTNAALVGLVTQDQSCVGMGLIRGVDVEEGLIYILTPACEEDLALVVELHVGSLELPPQLLHSDKYVSPYSSFFCMSSEGTGAGKVKSRNNLKRPAHNP